MTMTSRHSVIIPAHDEAAVIGRTLDALLADALPGEFDVIVVANGCSDHTAALVRRIRPEVRVIEQGIGNKTVALNAGLDVAREGAVLMLDADVELTTAAARTLLATARAPGVDAAIGHMVPDFTGVSFLVRMFYAAWLLHPYFDGGKFAAAYALSVAGRARLGRFPNVTADDEYLARLLSTSRTCSTQACFRVAPPRALAALLAVRTRSRRGTRALGPAVGGGRRHLLRLFRRPSLWIPALVYGAVTMIARVRARLLSGSRWERDLSSRAPSVGR